MRLVIALLLVPMLASAAPKFTTAVTVNVEDQPAGFVVVAKLDACWKKPAKAKAKITVEDGKITTVEIVESSDPRVNGCLEKRLLAATTDATAGVVATVELDGAKPPPPAKKVGLLTKDKKKIDVLLDRNIDLSKFNGITGPGQGFGPGTGTGVGTGVGTGTTRGHGTGGGGTAEGDFVAKGPIDTGAGRRAPTPVIVKLGPIAGGAVELERVVKSRAGIFRACYQKELNRTPAIAGNLVVDFTITAEGMVTKASAKSSTLKSDAVEKCVLANVMRLKFPAQSAAIDVTYPFDFSH